MKLGNIPIIQSQFLSPFFKGVLHHSLISLSLSPNYIPRIRKQRPTPSDPTLRLMQVMWGIRFIRSIDRHMASLPSSRDEFGIRVPSMEVYTKCLETWRPYDLDAFHTYGGRCRSVLGNGWSYSSALVALVILDFIPLGFFKERLTALCPS